MAAVIGAGVSGAISAIGSFDFAMLVHGEQSFVQHREIPVEGSLTATGKIVGIYDKGSGAVVAVEGECVDNATGETLAYVGNGGALSSAHHVDGVRALRQAGSTLKPFLYQLVLERRLLTAASLLEDSPVNLETPTGLYVPQNYDRSFRGLVSLRASLAGSLNVPAVRTLMLLGPDTLVERLVPAEIEAVLAHELGHFKLKHVTKRLVFSFVASLGFLALLGWLATQPWFYQGLGVEPSPAGGNEGLALLLFLIVLPVFTFVLAPIGSLLSRKQEFEADAFAARHARPGRSQSPHMTVWRLHHF
jgi:hypothetical protein